MNHQFMRIGWRGIRLRENRRDQEQKGSQQSGLKDGSSQGDLLNRPEIQQGTGPNSTQEF
jgi:hypothetical protein